MKSIVNQFHYIEVKMLFISSYKKQTVKKYFIRKDTENFNNADKYHICDKKYKETDIRVRDHCHITAKYRGSAHKGCNVNLKIDANNMNIPIIFTILEVMILIS